MNEPNVRLVAGRRILAAALRGAQNEHSVYSVVDSARSLGLSQADISKCLSYEAEIRQTIADSMITLAAVLGGKAKL